MMQHQYWVTKRTVLKKLGTKEDDCVVSSDAELDAKLELFRSISDSCVLLQKLIDQYQERLCTLSQEENNFGKFLHEAGKVSGPAGKYMITSGKAISYSGQQRLMLRNPLLRMYSDVETFRAQALTDMRCTISSMEKARNDYRAALSWMKAESAQLDPDCGRGVNKFRKAQAQVRDSKKVFDKLTLDVLEKIDLLSAARCNMFSQVLAQYQRTFLTFATNVSQTMSATAKSLKGTPQIDFCILKELSQAATCEEAEKDGKIITDDKDQMLFFQEEFKDDIENTVKETKVQHKEKLDKTQDVSADLLVESSNLLDIVDRMFDVATPKQTDLCPDLLGLRLESEETFSPFEDIMSSHLLDTTTNSATPQKNDFQSDPMDAEPSTSSAEPKTLSLPAKKEEIQRKDMTAWFKLFAELDPLSNPDALPGSNSDQSHTA